MVARYLPAAGAMLRSEVCVYTRAPDEHFLFGPHPHHTQLVIASPCSGHGFKFASLFGDIAADLAISGSTDKPIALFRPGRLIG
jgi:sarcosine oxidase